LDKTGLKASDVTPVPTDDAGKAGELFAAGQVDAAVTWEPWLSKVTDGGKGKLLVSSKGAKDILIGILAANRNKLPESNDKLARFLRGWYRGLSFIQSNRAEALPVIAKGFNIPEADIDGMLSGLRFIGLDEAKRLLGAGQAKGEFDLMDAKRPGGGPATAGQIVITRLPGSLVVAKLATSRLRRLLFAAILPAVVLVVWWGITASGAVERYFLPRPDATLAAAGEMLGTSSFWRDMGWSWARIVGGFMLAAGAAIPCGIAMGRNRTFNLLVEPAISFIRFVPMPAIIPLMILWFGSGEWGKWMIICLGVFFQLVLMVADVVANVPEAYYDIAHSVHATRWQRLRHFTLPAAAPGTWATLIFAEILGATSGLGYLIVSSQRYLLTERIFVAVVVIGIMGVLADMLFERLYHLWFPWSAQGQRKESV